MATDDGAIVTEAPLIPPAVSQSDSFATDPTRARSSNKRARETTPTSPAASPDALSPSKIARLVRFARESPVPLTGAAALEDQRRAREEEQRLSLAGTSDNPGQRALADLMSSPEVRSRPQDAPLETAAPAVDAASRILGPIATNIAGNDASSDPKDVSPQSATSAGVASLGDAGHVVHSPVPMDLDARQDPRLYAPQPDAQMEDKVAASLSYPGILAPGVSIAPPAPPPRGMSVPMATSQNPDLAPRSPSSSSKKHKCPYCDTEFTRHHNLKSHLLTHSQEKPYMCQTCQMRFRRLHDLKRHSKLHTGEKPHVCPKCDRKFARGDALARHSKGAGGCAGRRTSMGSYAGEDDFEGPSTTETDDAVMAGVMYDGNPESDMTEEERRRLSLPSIKAQHVSGQGAPDAFAAHSHTYPPAGRSNTGSGLYPPNMDRGTLSSTTSPSMPNSAGAGHTPHTSVSSMPVSAGNSSLYSQGGMAESPKPLSPAGAQAEASQQRPGASIHAQFRPSEHQPAPGSSQPPHGMSVTGAAAQQAWLSNYPPADGKPTEGAPAKATALPAPRVRSSGSLSQGRGTNGAENNNNLFAAGEQGIWAYLQHFEDRLKQLTAEVEAGRKTEAHLMEKFAASEGLVASLTDEVAALRQQLATLQGPA